MVPYAVIRRFLAKHRGYYCEACLARKLRVAVDDIRQSVGELERSDITTAYRMCQECLAERRVVGLRTRS